MRNAIFFLLWGLFYLFFWQEAFGLNLVVFALLLQFTARLFFGAEGLILKREWPYILAFALSAYGVLMLNSALSLTSFILINIGYLSFIWQAQLSVGEHFVNGLIRGFNIKQYLLPQRFGKGPRVAASFFSLVKLSLVPLILFMVFFGLFRAGNPIFRNWSNGFKALIDQLFADFSWALFWLMILGFLVLRMVFLSGKSWPLRFKVGDDLIRSKKAQSKRRFKINALRREYKMALLVFASLNILLLCLNSIDIPSFWFGFEMPEGFSLKEFLHEGVAFLMISLILAAAVVFYFFRKNINFYPHNKLLTVLAKLWIIQNGILSISVILRTAYYIDFHGLANGRIAVLSVMTVVLYSLFLLYQKVNAIRSHAYVFKKVSLYVMFLLAGMSAWDWDSSTARYNLAHGQINEIDVDNYLDLHPRVYPLIYAQLDRVEVQIKAHANNERRWINYQDLDAFRKALDRRRDHYLKQEQKQGIWSWNWADQRATTLLSRPSRS